MGKKIEDYIRLFPRDTVVKGGDEYPLSNRLGNCILTGVISAKVSEEINGSYESVLEYDMDDDNFNSIKKDMILVMRVDPYEKYHAQAFRVYSINTNLMTNTATINARHISYDLSNYILRELPIRYRKIDDLINIIRLSFTSEWDGMFVSPFSIQIEPPLTDDRYVEFGTTEPRSIRNIIGDGDDCILSKYGKVSEIDDIDNPDDTLEVIKNKWREYLERESETSIINYEIEYDNSIITIHPYGRGSDTRFTVRYGGNLTEFTNELKADEMYTHVYPYFQTTKDSEPPEVVVDGTVTAFNELDIIFHGEHDVEPYDVWHVLESGYFVALIDPELQNHINWTDRRTLEPSPTTDILLSLPYSYDYKAKSKVKNGSTITYVQITIHPYDICKFAINEDSEVRYKAMYQLDETGKDIPTDRHIRWQAVGESDTNDKTVYMDIIHNTDGAIMWGSEEDMFIPTRLDSPNISNNDVLRKILPYNCATDWQNEYKYTANEIPSNYEIIKAGQKFIKDNSYTESSKVSMKLSFEMTHNDSELRELFENVKLGDTVHVRVEKLGIRRSAEVVKTEYDVLANRYTSIEIGEKFKDLTSRMIR